jgi:purine nucleoside permease
MWGRLTATESLAEQKAVKYSAHFPALDAAYAVGQPVVDTIVPRWSEYRDQRPSDK